MPDNKKEKLYKKSLKEIINWLSKLNTFLIYSKDFNELDEKQKREKFLYYADVFLENEIPQNYFQFPLKQQPAHNRKGQYFLSKAMTTFKFFPSLAELNAFFTDFLNKEIKLKDKEKTLLREQLTEEDITFDLLSYPSQKLYKIWENEIKQANLTNKEKQELLLIKTKNHPDLLQFVKKQHPNIFPTLDIIHFNPLKLG